MLATASSASVPDHLRQVAAKTPRAGRTRASFISSGKLTHKRIIAAHLSPRPKT
jgi:hypothetical protein